MTSADGHGSGIRSTSASLPSLWIEEAVFSFPICFFTMTHRNGIDRPTCVKTCLLHSTMAYDDATAPEPLINPPYLSLPRDQKKDIVGKPSQSPREACGAPPPGMLAQCARPRPNNVAQDGQIFRSNWSQPLQAARATATMSVKTFSFVITDFSSGITSTTISLPLLHQAEHTLKGPCSREVYSTATVQCINHLSYNLELKIQLQTRLQIQLQSNQAHQRPHNEDASPPPILHPHPPRLNPLIVSLSPPRTRPNHHLTPQLTRTSTLTHASPQYLTRTADDAIDLHMIRTADDAIHLLPTPSPLPTTCTPRLLTTATTTTSLLTEGSGPSPLITALTKTVPGITAVPYSCYTATATVTAAPAPTDCPFDAATCGLQTRCVTTATATVTVPCADACCPSTLTLTSTLVAPCQTACGAACVTRVETVTASVCS